ncbi:uroporphyrinogen decarboxylase, partial [Fulvivirgaceae bacterium PWU5]
MGLNYEMEEKRGPVFPKRITSAKDLDSIHIAEAGELQYVLDALTLTKKELNGRVPLIGFAGAPWTIFSYMIEGKGSKTFSEAKKMLYTEP